MEKPRRRLLRRMLTEDRAMLWVLLAMVPMLTLLDRVPGHWVWFAGMAMSAAGLAWMLAKPGRMRAVGLRPVQWFCLGLALACAAWGVRAGWIYPRVTDMSGTRGEVSGIVLEQPEVYSGTVRVRLRMDSYRNTPKTCTILLDLPADAEVRTGDRVTGWARLRIPESTKLLSGEVDRLRYYRCQGVYLKGKLDGAYTVETPETCDFRVWPGLLAERFQSRLRQFLPEDAAAVASAWMLGEKSGLDSATLRAFRLAGIAHLSAVSGMHVGFLVSLVLLLFRRKLGTVIAIPAMVVFALMVGGGPSVWRAVLMQTVFLLAWVVRRDSDTRNTLCAAGVLLLTVNPFLITSVSLWLSFAATLGLLIVGMPMQKRLYLRLRDWNRRRAKRLQPVLAVFCTSIAALVLTMPISLLVFGGISTVSPLANLLIVPVAEAAFYGGMLCVGAGAIWAPLGRILAYPVTWLLRWGKCSAKAIAALPCAYLPSSGYLRITLLALYILILLLRSRSRKHPSEDQAPLRRQVGCAILLIATVAALCGTWERYGRMDIAALDTGGGQCTVVRYENSCIVVGCGGYLAADTLTDTLESWGVQRIDALVIPAWRNADCSGAEEILRTWPVQLLLMAQPPAKKESEAAALMPLAENARVVRSDTVLESTILRLRLLPAADSGFDRNRLAVSLETTAGTLVWPGAIDAAESEIQWQSLSRCDLVFAGDYYTTHALPKSLLNCQPSVVVLLRERGTAETAALTERRISHVNISETGTLRFRLRQP